MENISFELFRIPGADMGEINCLPDIKNDNYIHAGMTKTDRVGDDELPFLGKGMIRTLLPYDVQDGYNRSRDIKSFPSVVLENDYLKARFVPALGGRLWSLYDKKQNRELIYNNDVFQPGNLALRNAWFSGGVEWNVGMKGHTPLTCSPMFAQKLECADGKPMLRMYEFERIREIVYCITAKLEGDVLIVHNSIENTAKEDKSMYWWSNIAVEETPDTRVIVPAENSYYCTYLHGSYVVDSIPVPILDGKDVSYPLNVASAKDFFYKIPDSEKKWIAAVNGSGIGLVQMSDDILKGRKLFVWGSGDGGRRWNQWLSDSGKNYIEIQAGLCRTQLEHFIMEKESVIEWTEAYSCICGDKSRLHSNDYAEAIDEVKRNIISKQQRMQECSLEIAKEYPCEYFGSGWGALEEKVRGTAVSNRVCFPKESMNVEQEPWNRLLAEGAFAPCDTNQTIVSYVKGDFWLRQAEQAPDSWMKYYHLGTMYYEKEDIEKAMECFQKSVEICENPWAYRCLAQLERKENNHPEAAITYIESAIRLKCDYKPLLVDYAEIMIENEKYEQWISCYRSLNDTLKNDGRLKILYAMCLNQNGQMNEALEILRNGFDLYDIKEGEYSTFTLWMEIHRNLFKEQGEELSDEEILKRCPLPYELDFRMH